MSTEIQQKKEVNNLIDRESLLKRTGLTAGKLRRLITAGVIVFHAKDEKDNRIFKYLEDNIEVRSKIFKILSESNSIDLSQEKIGEIFAEKFGADDSILTELLKNQKPKEVIDEYSKKLLKDNQKKA